MASNTIRNRATATPRVANLSKAVNKSEFNSPNSKSSVERRSAKVPTSPEPQTRLNQIKEDLKKANDRISSLDFEKAKALDELNGAKKEAEQATGKLINALKPHKCLDENSEIEIFQAVKARIEADKKKKELDHIKKQHALDSAALLFVVQELKKVNEELAAAKSKALSQADDSRKMAEIQGEKINILSSELERLKTLLDSTKKKEFSDSEMVSKLEEEIVVLKRDFEKATHFEAEVKEQEMIIEKLIAELEAEKMAKSCAHTSLEEWKSKVKELEEQLEEANKLERSVSISLESVMKQLQGNNDKLHNMGSEITDLKEKNMTLETIIAKQKEDLEESEKRLGSAEEELSSKFEREVKNLKSELETVEKEKNQSLNKEKDAVSSVERLVQEKSKLLSELENSKEEEDKTKKAMESLASTLQGVSSEAMELKEKLSQGAHEYEDLKMVMKATNENYENMLEEARHENDVLVSAVEQTKKDFESSKTDWEMKEADSVNYVKKMEEEVASMGEEMNRLENLVKRTEEEADAARQKEVQTKERLKEVESELVCLKEARVESLKLKENLLDKETKLREDENLGKKEEVSMKKKTEKLAKLLEEEKGELNESEEGYDNRSVVEEKPPKVETIGDEASREKKEESPVEAFSDKKAEVEFPEDDDSSKFDESERTSTASTDEIWNALTPEEQRQTIKKKKKKTILDKVGDLFHIENPKKKKAGDILKKKPHVNQK